MTQQLLTWLFLLLIVLAALASAFLGWRSILRAQRKSPTSRRRVTCGTVGLALAVFGDRAGHREPRFALVYQA